MNRRQASETAERGGHALLWATLGALAATYAHRRYYKSRTGGAGATQTYGSQGLNSDLGLGTPQGQGSSQGQGPSRAAGLMAVVSDPAQSDSPIPSPALQDLGAGAQQEPIAEDPYPQGNPTPLPTGPAPGG